MCIRDRLNGDREEGGKYRFLGKIYLHQVDLPSTKVHYNVKNKRKDFYRIILRVLKELLILLVNLVI